VADDEVEPAGLERWHRLVRFLVGGEDRERGEALAEADEGRHEERLRGGGERGHPQRAGHLAAETLEVGDGRLAVGEDAFGVLDETHPRIRQPDAARRALEKRHADLAFKRGHLLGDGRRREPQRLGRCDDGTVFGYLTEYAEACRVEHEVILRSAT
jgi:hypothetical protein